MCCPHWPSQASQFPTGDSLNLCALRSLSRHGWQGEFPGDAVPLSSLCIFLSRQIKGRPCTCLLGLLAPGAPWA